ncbi:hypothetical protein [Asticcacaulis taihuensis]|uniref:hypothetical protein n=1 Tax=Asticcacaulis taihuensis TaxID=260084 RepID=UPI003F7C66B2
MQRGPSKAWFAPKRYGYGAGLPIAWQGWAVLAVYFLIVLGAATGLPKLIPNPAIYAVTVSVIVLVCSVVLIIICARTTKGGWHWRWDGKP